MQLIGRGGILKLLFFNWIIFDPDSSEMQRRYWNGRAVGAGTAGISDGCVRPGSLDHAVSNQPVR